MAGKPPKRAFNDVDDDAITLATVERMTCDELLTYLKAEHGVMEHTLKALEGDVDGQAFIFMATAEMFKKELGVTPGQANKLAAIVHALKRDAAALEPLLPSVTDEFKTYEGRFWALRSREDITATRLADPGCINLLPFPFVGPCRPIDRFKYTEKGEFEYQGREAFTDIFKAVLDMRMTGNAYRSMYLHGTLGYGKSHVLCAVVCLLFKQGRRVVYVPDCKELASDVLSYLQESFSLAFGDDRKMMQRIAKCSTTAELRSLSKQLSKEGITVYFVLDQTNWLDETSPGNHSKAAKAEILDLFGTLTSIHICIKSASANHELAHEMRLTQESVQKIDLYGGLSATEMKHWWTIHEAHLPELTPQFREAMEDMSGRNPLLLRGFLRAAAEYKVEYPAEGDGEGAVDAGSGESSLWRKVHATLEWIEAQARIARFARALWRTENQRELEWSIECMENCVIGGIVPWATTCLDYRYFYADRGNIGHYTCGLARNMIASFLRSVSNTPHRSESWWNIVPLLDNTSVLGFFIEDLFLSVLATDGLAMDGQVMSDMKVNRFRQFPIIPTEETRPSLLFVPEQYNYGAVDAIVVRLEKAKEPTQPKTATIIPIQVTIASSHSDSEENFFRTWSEFLTKLLGRALNQYDINVKFLWVVENAQQWSRKDEFVEAKHRKTRTGEYLVHPAYQRLVRGVDTLCSPLGKQLQLAKENMAEKRLRMDDEM